MKKKIKSSTQMVNVLYGLLEVIDLNLADTDAVADRAILELLFLTDPSAAEDLSQAIFFGRHFNMAVRAEAQEVLSILGTYGVIEQAEGNCPDMLNLKFRARPLINLLKRMPHRDPVTGLLKFSSF